MKQLVMYIMAIIGALFLYSCQGPLDSSINDLFETYGDMPSASGIPSTGTNSSGTNNGKGQNSEEIMRKLVGKWVIVKQIIDDGEGKEEVELDGYHGVHKNEDYIIFNADFSYEQSSPYIFEAENRGSTTWRLENKQVVLDELFYSRHSETRFDIMQLSSTTLQLRWADEEAYLELTTFRKAN